MVGRGEGRGAPHKPGEIVPLEVSEGGGKTLGLPQAVCFTGQVEHALSRSREGVAVSFGPRPLEALSGAESVSFLFCGSPRPNQRNGPRPISHRLPRIEHGGELRLRDAYGQRHRHAPSGGRGRALSWTQGEYPRAFVQDNRSGTRASPALRDGDGPGFLPLRVM